MNQAPMISPYMSPSYNAVKIDVHNPSVNAPGAVPQYNYPPQYNPQYAPVNAPQYNYPQYDPQYAPVNAPQYSYPQTPLYNYPQAAQQPYYPPQVAYPAVQYPQPYPVAQPVPAAIPAAVQNAEVIPAPVYPVTNPQVIQQNYNAPMVPQPVVTQTPAAAPVVQQPVEIVPPAPMAPQVDLNGFLAKLNNPDYEVQANAMEEIANMVKVQPEMAVELLDEKIINALTSTISADSSKLAGPTPEQITARQKLMSGQKMSEAEQQAAMAITPMEQSERNKSYAMFTTAILQKLYSDEVTKLTGTTVPITELPGITTIVDNLKDNDNPMVRTSAIEALSYIQNPAYKQDLTTLFTVAQNDSDPNVKEAAKAALDKLNTI
ncbi:MAG: hypothetical protein LBK53_07850 [Heliobacteriaceae bacterium]|jgi:hypothetical protein|nr:hypothetical protein [Heliobacteriaceae bacterium]